ncbi:MAG: putative rane protein [Verrucomicrobiaceae bacterium]|nr:putative rane protein [Verrucomicrobiaceae bacterium]
MVIVWRGLGWLVAVIVFGFSLVANLVFNNVYGEGFYDTHKWPLALSLVGSAIVCWFLGSHLKSRSDRIAIDKATGQEIVINQSQHTLFFIPMRLWGPLLALIALIVFVVERTSK